MVGPSLFLSSGDGYWVKYHMLFKLFLNVYLFLRERERQSANGEGAERERERDTQNLKKAPASVARTHES